MPNNINICKFYVELTEPLVLAFQMPFSHNRKHAKQQKMLATTKSKPLKHIFPQQKMNLGTI